MKIILSCLLVGVAITGFADDWPQAGGLNRNHTSAETGLLKVWPDAGPEVLWTASVSEGFSAPAVKEGRVYVLDHDGKQSAVRCLDLTSGKDLWKCTFDDPAAVENTKYSGTRGTPTVLDNHLYTVTVSGMLVCVDLKSHEVVWSKRLVVGSEVDVAKYGVAHQPLVYDNKLIIAPLSEEANVMALDLLTGETIWKTTGFAGTGYVSPNVMNLGGEDQIIVVSGGTPSPNFVSRRRKKKAPEAPVEKRSTYIFAVSPKDGLVRWKYDEWFCHRPIPQPVAMGNDQLFVSSGYAAGSHFFQIEKNGNDYSAKKIAESSVSSWIGQPVCFENHIYIGGNEKSNKDTLTCLDSKGTIQWSSKDIEEAPKFEHLNMILADGMIIGLDGKKGMLHLIKADAKGYKELAAAQVVKEKNNPWAPLALSDGLLLVRDQSEMKCMKLK